MESILIFGLVACLWALKIITFLWVAYGLLCCFVWLCIKAAGVGLRIRNLLKRARQ